MTPTSSSGVFCFSLYLSNMKIIRLSESQLTNVVKRVISENDSKTEKDKRFLKNKLGIDFTGKILMITSTYDVPVEFDEYISRNLIRRYLNNYGPMYLFKLDGKKYLYQDIGKYEWFLREDGFDYTNNEIPEKLGIAIMGLRFSDIIDMYFKEEENI